MTEALFPFRPGRENARPGEMMEIWPVLAPHTPDLPGSWKGGGGRPLIGAYSRLRSEFDRWGADFETVVAYTPGWQTRNITLLDASPEHRSSRDYSGFGHDYRYDPPGAPGLAACLLRSAKASGIPISTGFHGVDHAVSIPLFFLVPDGETPVLPVSQSLSGVRQASLLGETLGKIDCPGHGSGRILLLMSGIWSQNPREMAKREKDPLVDRWIARILSKLSGGSLPDWSFLPELTREVLDRLDAPGRLRELHLLKGIGAGNARVWETERDFGIFQALISFDPVRPETRGPSGFPRPGGSFRSGKS